MKVVMIDDEIYSIVTLKNILNKFSEIEVVKTYSSVIDAEKEISNLKFDILFLDIQMPAKSGLQFLKELKEFDFEVVFVTVLEEYALQAFQLSAFDYIVKPVRETDINRVLDKLSKVQLKAHNIIRLNSLFRNLNHPEKELLLTRGKECIPIKPSEIIYVKVEKDYVNIVSVKGKLGASGSMVRFLDFINESSISLPVPNLVRISKNHAINLKFLKGFNIAKTIVVMDMAHLSSVSDDISLSVSDTFKRRIKKYYKEFSKR